MLKPLKTTFGKKIGWRNHLRSNWEAPRTILMSIKKEQSYFWVYSRKNRKHSPEEMYACTCSKEHYSQQTPGGSTPNAHWGWMDKENEVYIYSGILFSLKKKEILSHASTWMSFEKIMLCEISHSYKKTNTDSPYMKCLKAVKFIKTECWLPGIGTGKGGVAVSQFCKMAKFLGPVSEQHEHT